MIAQARARVPRCHLSRSKRDNRDRTVTEFASNINGVTLVTVVTPKNTLNVRALGLLFFTVTSVTNVTSQGIPGFFCHGRVSRSVTRRDTSPGHGPGARCPAPTHPAKLARGPSLALLWAGLVGGRSPWCGLVGGGPVARSTGRGVRVWA